MNPSSTFERIKINIHFLGRIVRLNIIAVTFMEMLPDDGTSIKNEPIKQERFKGDVKYPDYDFLNSQIKEYFNELRRLMFPWVNGADPLNHQLNTFWHKHAILGHLSPPTEGLDEYRKFLKDKTHDFNEAGLATLTNLQRPMKTGRDVTAHPSYSLWNDNRFSKNYNEVVILLLIRTKK